MKTAVILPVKDELTGLPRLLEILYPQLEPEDEIIAIDAGSEDGSWEFLTCYAATHPQLIPLRAEGACPGEARNVGIAFTDAPIVAQLDGGNQPNDRWLERISTPVREGTVDYIMGNSQILPNWRTVFGKKVDIGSIFGAVTIRGRVLREGPPPETPKQDDHFADFAAGGDSVCYKREMWEQVGGFAGWLRFGSDPLYVRKLARLKPRYAFAEGAVSYWNLGRRVEDILERRARSQRRKLRTWTMLKAHRWEVLWHLFVGLALVAGVFFNDIRPWALAALLIPASLQAVKSIRTWCIRNHPDMDQACRPMQLAVVLTLTPLLDVLGVLARIYGTVDALIRLPRLKEDWDDNVQRYLNE